MLLWEQKMFKSGSRSASKYTNKTTWGNTSTYCKCSSSLEVEFLNTPCLSPNLVCVSQTYTSIMLLIHLDTFVLLVFVVALIYNWWWWRAKNHSSAPAKVGEEEEWHILNENSEKERRLPEYLKERRILQLVCCFEISADCDQSRQCS